MSPRIRVSSPYLDTVRNRRIADAAIEVVPDPVSGYVEPLLNGGAVAIALLQRHPDAVFRLNSPDAALVEVWEVVHDEVEPLIEEVSRLRRSHDPACFAEVRDLPPSVVEQSSPVERAARFVYLRGSARGDQAGPLREFSGANYGRDSVAFDEASVRGLHELLRARDVRFSAHALFGTLAAIGEGDLVYLDPAAADRSGPPRELRSFVSAVAAKGAFLLAPGEGHPRPDSGVDDTYAGWPGMSLLDSGPDAERLWANSLLVRSLRREGRLPGG
jgi:hypothetical protein